MRAGGAALMREVIIEVSGITPDHAALKALFETAATGPDLVATSHVATDLPDMARVLPADVAGLLYLRAARGWRIGFFRKARERVVLWAGSPEKTVVLDKGAPRLDPRRSFEPFREVHGGGARPWSGEEMHLAGSLRDLIARGSVTAASGEDGRGTEGAPTLPVIHALLEALALATTEIVPKRTRPNDPDGESPVAAGDAEPEGPPDRPDGHPCETDGMETHAVSPRLHDGNPLDMPRRRLCLVLTGDVDLARTVAAALFATGVETVDIAHRPAEALRALGRALPDLAVLDLAAGAGVGMDRLITQLEAFGVKTAYLGDAGAVGSRHVQGSVVINKSLRGYRLRLALAEPER
jgi:hypothetical protein